MKATGAEIWAYWQAWPAGDDWYIDDYDINVEAESGVCLIDPASKYDLDDLGSLYFQGKGAERDRRDPVSIKSSFLAWKKAQTHTSLAVTLPKTDIDEFTALCKQRGWKVA